MSSERKKWLIVILLVLLVFSWGALALRWYQDSQVARTGFQKVAECVKSKGAFLLCSPEPVRQKQCRAYEKDMWNGSYVSESPINSQFYSSGGEPIWILPNNTRADFRSRPYFIASKVGCV